MRHSWRGLECGSGRPGRLGEDVDQPLRAHVAAAGHERYTPVAQIVGDPECGSERRRT
jgi:hypothetical protein